MTKCAHFWPRRTKHLITGSWTRIEVTGALVSSRPAGSRGRRDASRFTRGRSVARRADHARGGATRRRRDSCPFTCSRARTSHARCLASFDRAAHGSQPGRPRRAGCVCDAGRRARRGGRVSGSLGCSWPGSTDNAPRRGSLGFDRRIGSAWTDHGPSRTARVETVCLRHCGTPFVAVPSNATLSLPLLTGRRELPSGRGTRPLVRVAGHDSGRARARAGATSAARFVPRSRPPHPGCGHGSRGRARQLDRRRRFSYRARGRRHADPGRRCRLGARLAAAVAAGARRPGAVRASRGSRPTATPARWRGSRSICGACLAVTGVVAALAPRSWLVVGLVLLVVLDCIWSGATARSGRR